MKLKDYRTTVVKISRAKLGQIIGSDGITIWRYETGKTVPSKYVIERIKTWSNGNVSEGDF